MGYIQDNLMANEKILFSARVHPAVFIRPGILLIMSIGSIIYAFRIASQITDTSGVIAGFMLMIAGFIFFLSLLAGVQAFLIMSTTEFAVTNRRVIAKTGFIHRRTLEMLIPKIESVRVSQGILGRILNFGNVTVTGTGGTHETFIAIVEPIGVRKKVNQIIEDYTQAYSQYQQQKAAQAAGG